MFINAESERLTKRRCTANGPCFCTGRCMHTEMEWRELEEIKKNVRFTGVDEMKNKID